RTRGAAIRHRTFRSAQLRRRRRRPDAGLPDRRRVAGPARAARRSPDRLARRVIRHIFGHLDSAASGWPRPFLPSEGGDEASRRTPTTRIVEPCVARPAPEREPAFRVVSVLEKRLLKLSDGRLKAAAANIGRPTRMALFPGLFMVWAFSVFQ